MSTTYPTHPDDHEMLLKIRRYLIGFRFTNGWTQEELSQRISGTKSGVYTLENGDFSWHVSRLQKWVAAFDLTLHSTPVFEGSHPETFELWHELVEEDPRVAWMRALMDEDTKGRHAWQRAYLTAYLKVMREVKGVTPRQLGDKLGISADAVKRWETDGDEILLPKLLSHARALGGTIRLEIS